MSFIFYAPCLCWILCLGIYNSCAWAQESEKLVSLTKQIIEAQDQDSLSGFFEELTGLYFKENKYGECVMMLRSIGQKKDPLLPFADYYIALTRFNQLKNLEDKEEWDEYFSKGNDYREELTASADDAIRSTTTKDAINIRSKLLLWKFHKGQEDALQEKALSDLMTGILEYSRISSDIALIKNAADTLSAYNERQSSKELYKLYVEKLAIAGLEDDELENIALGFYRDGNLELSELVYDIYIERAAASYPKEKLATLLKTIARQFAYTECKYGLKDKEEEPFKEEGCCVLATDKDGFYAEKVFLAMQNEVGAQAFDDELMYLRGLNAEKIKSYKEAKDIYEKLLDSNPQFHRSDELNFKLGLICAYVLRDIEAAREYFKGLTQKEALSPQVISSYYQLGLLSQWQGDIIKARKYYKELLERAQDDFSDTVKLSKERIREIEEGYPIDYNLKVFLDVSLSDENRIYDMSKVELNACPFRPKGREQTNVCCSTFGTESGCLDPQMRYLWSGHIGTVQPALEQSAFGTTFTDPGTKEVNLVVVSPSGIIDRSIDMLDAE
ncbi:MAG: tetratricopeptide repeat protein [Candidatus Omnitrophica bacterium]|nr:tetratricopeptide repeat protein [Candidatus Omnitrophota bacterium]